MSFSDIFKSSFLENIASVSLLDMSLALVLAFGLGLFIFFVYKKTYSGVNRPPKVRPRNLTIGRSVFYGKIFI